MFADLPPGWPPGTARLILDTVDSTNAEARRRAGTLALPTWILARRQTAGKGRRGRAWADAEGNFAATLVLPDPGPPERAAQRSFLAALALRDVLVALSPGAVEASLKWPNDVLLDGAKVAGILLEGTAAGPVRQLAIGIGVNLVDAPPALATEAGALPATSLRAEFGTETTATAFLDRLAPAYAAWEARFAEMGFAPIRHAFLSHAARRGARISARLPGRTLDGIFEDIDAAGALVLRTATGAVAIQAADIHF